MSNVWNEMLDKLDAEIDGQLEVPEVEEKEIIENGQKHIVRDDDLELTVYVYKNRLHVFEVKELHGRNRTPNTSQTS